MTLRSRLLLAAAATVIVVFGISEALAQRQAAAFFHEHELRLAQGSDHGVLLSALQDQKRALVWGMAALRLASGAFAVAALSVILGLLWKRMISRPIALLLDKMGKMSRGTWNQPIPVEQDDEIGRLLHEFNLLGPRLTFAAHQYAAAAKLAAMALIGQRVVRKANAASSNSGRCTRRSGNTIRRTPPTRSGQLRSNYRPWPKNLTRSSKPSSNDRESQPQAVDLWIGPKKSERHPGISLPFLAAEGIFVVVFP
jgi:hypothetical protein